MFFYFSRLFNDLIDTRNERYRLVATLDGHGGPINTFSFNLNGSLLASGGDDEKVRIWDLHAFRQHQTLTDRSSTWGQITCVKFLNVESGQELLCFGTGRGYLLLYHRQRKTVDFVETCCLQVFNRGDSVETFAFDPHYGRVAISSHYGGIKMLRLQGTNLVEVWKDKLEIATIPRAMAFVDRGESINIFTMESGVVYCRDAETSVVKQTKGLKTSIGNVSMCPATGNILIDNMTDGFDLYSANRHSPIRTFPVRLTKRYVKGGLFAEGGRAVVCGSDHGKVYVFPIADTKPRQELLHGNSRHLIQTVATYSTSNTHTIATGVSDGRCDIYIWRRLANPSSKQGKSQMSAMNALILINVLFLCIFAWATSDKWFPEIKAVYNSVSTAIHTSSVRAFDVKISMEQPQNPALMDILQGPGLAEILLDLDDETLRKVLKVSPALRLDDLRRDESELVIDKPQER